MACMVKDEVKKLKAYTVEGKRPEIKLDANESPFGLPMEMIDRLKESISLDTLNRYPDARAEKLCEKLADYVGCGVCEDMIMAGDGSDELINIIISAFLSKGSPIILPTPSFSMYSLYSSVNEGTIIPFSMDGDFKLDIDRLIETALRENPGLIFICNPNNPTGTLTPREDIKKLLENCGCMVVLDEAYYEFSGITDIDMVKSHDNLIVLRTMSKAWGMAGLRLGYLTAQKSIIDELLKVKSPFNVNSITQEIACIMLNYKNYMSERVKLILKERDFLAGELKKFEGFKVFDTWANFVMVRVKDPDLLSAELRKRGIAVRNFNSHQETRGCLRITAGTSYENKRLIAEIKAIVGE